MILCETSNAQKYTKDEFAFFKFCCDLLLGLHAEVIIQIIEKKLSALVPVHAELEQTINCYRKFYFTHYIMDLSLLLT